MFNFSSRPRRMNILTATMGNPSEQASIHAVFRGLIPIKAGLNFESRRLQDVPPDIGCVVKGMLLEGLKFLSRYHRGKNLIISIAAYNSKTSMAFSKTI